MTKVLLTLAAISLTATSSAFAGETRGPAATSFSNGNTTEVRYVSNPRKGSPVSKLVITRDASGKIVSVKRG